MLNDYQLIEDQAIHEAMAFLLDHLPINLHVILASRVDPDLPLARWRTRGYLLELSDGDLSFTQQETACFLTRVPDQHFQAEEIAQLHQRTEGWVAGVQLATLTLHKHTDCAFFLQRFTGSHRYLIDYVQHFLLRIAVLSRSDTWARRVY